MLDDWEIDELARAGYRYATGVGGIPSLLDDFELACFNSGIANANARHELLAQPITVKAWFAQSGCESREHDKTVGALNY